MGCRKGRGGREGLKKMKGKEKGEKGGREGRGVWTPPPRFQTDRCHCVGGRQPLCLKNSDQ
jgi:hypothetical protein